MRIISGSAKGRRLMSPPSQRIRPTIDRVKESLFSILGDVEDLTLLDAFAGSGALGCEALSRGAAFCYFCDPSREALSIIKHNVTQILRADEDTFSILPRPVERALALVDRPLDLIFLDPPYADHALLDDALSALCASPHVTTDALFVVEQSADAPSPTHALLRFDEERRYGGTRITFLYRV